MDSPVRLQLSRRRGFNLQAASHAINGLPAVSVARPGQWGNPFTLTVGRGAPEAVELFERSIRSEPTLLAAARRELFGKNLACWCRPGELCHADVLLRVANRPQCEAVDP